MLNKYKMSSLKSMENLTFKFKNIETLFTVAL